MITQEDTNYLKSMFVTKDEHESAFAHIVEHMATKEDLANAYTYMQENLATKEDIADIRVEMATKKDIQRLDEKIDTKFDTLVNMLDGIVGTLDSMRLEMAASAYQYVRQVEWNHKVAQKLDIPFDY